MSIAAAHAAQFYRDVVRHGSVYTLEATQGILIFPMGQFSVVPFWSTRMRISSIQQRVPEYSDYSVSEQTLDDFLNETVPVLEQNGIRMGLNWSGDRLHGYDVLPSDVRDYIKAERIRQRKH